MLNGKIYLYSEMEDPDFIIRVYGIYIDPVKGLLVSDERIKGKNYTKFPGGGMEYGEGTIDCLKRELVEETGDYFEVVEHFYTTDYFVESAFHIKRQVISIYYWVKPLGELNMRLGVKPFDFQQSDGDTESFRFIPLDQINPDDFELSIDHHVVMLLLNKIGP